MFFTTFVCKLTQVVPCWHHVCFHHCTNPGSHCPGARLVIFQYFHFSCLQHDLSPEGNCEVLTTFFSLSNPGIKVLIRIVQNVYVCVEQVGF